MVGEAFTLRYIPSREDIDVSSVFEDREHPQRKAVETVPAGHVLVMDCRQDKRAASAGSILVTRMMVRGAAGVVTDGGLRDYANDRAARFSGLLRRPVGAHQSHPPSCHGHQCSDRVRRGAASIPGMSSSAIVKASWSFRGISPTRSPGTDMNRR